MTKQSHKSPASEAVQSPPAVELASLESRRSLDITLAASDCLLRVEGRMWTYGEWGCMRVCICACVRPHLYFEKLNLLCYIKDLLPKAWRWQKDFTSEMRVTDPLCTWHALPLASPPPPRFPAVTRQGLKWRILLVISRFYEDWYDDGDDERRNGNGIDNDDYT